MPEITCADLRKQIAKSDFARMYFIYGEEKYLVSYYAKRLISKAGGDKFTDFNVQVFDGGETGVDRISEAAEALPFMSQRKCVAVHDLDMDTVRSAEAAKWYELLSNLPESTVLVIYLPTVDINFKKSRNWKKFIAKAQKSGNTLQFRKATNAQLEKMLISRASKLGCCLSRQNAGQMINSCGNDMRTLLNELEKLCSFVKSGEITKEDISKITVKNLEARVFDLSKAIIAGEYDKAYKILDILFYLNEEPVSILAVLSSAYIDMYRVKIMIRNGYRAADAAKHFDYARKEFRISVAERNAKRFSVKMLRESLYALLDADLSLKGAHGSRRTVMEELIARLLLIAEKRKLND